MNWNSHTDARPTCGYDSCSCRNVHFICSGGPRNDAEYCVDGILVRIESDGTIRKATPEQVEKIAAYFASEHAKYVEWHAEQMKKHGEFMPPLSPARTIRLIDPRELDNTTKTGPDGCFPALS